MNASDIVKIQRNLGVTTDGVMGRASYAALFSKLGASSTNADQMALNATVNFDDYGVSSSPLVLAHFLAQACQETGNFRWFEEIASGAAYEGRVDLGNTVPGYGVRFKGRGIFQLTGYTNYVIYSRKTGIDMVTDPTRAAHPDISVLTACVYWVDHKLTDAAAADDIEKVTRGINGGLTGLANRQAYLNKLKTMFGI